jgi:hypothetical protein
MVAEAMRLRPDMIVVDVGMPLLNGLDAARNQRAAAFSLRASCHGFPVWTGSCGTMGRGGLRSLGSVGLGNRARVVLSPAQARRQSGGSLLANEFPFLHSGLAISIPHGQKPLGNREPRQHICHHHANSLLIGWLLTMLAWTIERLYRLRYLHRRKHRVHSSAQLPLLLWLSLSRPCAADSS